jgi:hypothetical protein
MSAAQLQSEEFWPPPCRGTRYLVQNASRVKIRAYRVGRKGEYCALSSVRCCPWSSFVALVKFYLLQRNVCSMPRMPCLGTRHRFASTIVPVQLPPYYHHVPPPQLNPSATVLKRFWKTVAIIETAEKSQWLWQQATSKTLPRPQWPFLAHSVLPTYFLFAVPECPSRPTSPSSRPLLPSCTDRASVCFPKPHQLAEGSCRPEVVANIVRYIYTDSICYTQECGPVVLCYMQE